LSLVLAIVFSPFKGKARLEAEIIMLRHQLNVLRRSVLSKPKLGPTDRLFFTGLYRLFPSVLFLRNHIAGIGAMDFLVVPTINFSLLFVLVILWHERRRLISLSVTNHSTADWIARQITEAFPWNEALTHLIRDRDSAYGHAVTRRLSAMGIRDQPIAPCSPWQNGHAERLIGSLRRECLDHLPFSARPTCAASLRVTRATTTGSERICPWARMRRPIDRFNSLVSVSRGRSSAGFIISIAGHSLR
jgi:transposase InsO family protein